MRRILVVVFLAVGAFAQQYIGSGGGAAELRILQMIPNLKLWAKFCSENKYSCWDVHYNYEEINPDHKKFYDAINKLDINKVNFVPSLEAHGGCQNQTVTISRKDIYQNQDQAHVDEVLMKVLIRTIRMCADPVPSRYIDVPLRILALGKPISTLGLHTLEVIGGRSYLVSSTPGQNAHAILSGEINCSEYQILSSNSQTLWAECKEKKTKYEVRVLNLNPLQLLSVIH